MKFTEVPPTVPGYYYALPVGEDGLTIVLVEDLYEGRMDEPWLSVKCVFDAGQECQKYSGFADFCLWSTTPIEFPTFKNPNEK